MGTTISILTNGLLPISRFDVMILKYVYKFIGVSYFQFKTSTEFAPAEYSAFKTEHSACNELQNGGPFNSYVLFGQPKRNRRLHMNSIGETIKISVTEWVLLEKSDHSCYSIKLSSDSRILYVIPCKTQYHLS
jgi:hypothetical protein